MLLNIAFTVKYLIRKLQIEMLAKELREKEIIVAYA